MQGTLFDIAALRAEEGQLTQQLEQPEVWGDLTLSKNLSQQLQIIKNKLTSFDRIAKSVEELEVLLELIEAEQNSDNYIIELETAIAQTETELENLLLQTLLRGTYDSCNAIITIHSGAGGTESCDWTEILYRMYICYAEKHNFQIVECDRVKGDGAGIKSVTARIIGENAYGFLKAERGVHRLVRISPFDANSRRHTSFASVDVSPEVEAVADIIIKPDDLKIDTYRSSGAGGQHVNKTESAIRITHIPTGIVVACQNERSQVQNKTQAMKMLMGQLAERQELARQEEMSALKGEVKKIEWGSQIRSYVFCPYTMVKDHRTGCETSNIQSVINGNIDMFIIEYLKKLG